MTFERTADPVIVREIMTHPRIWPYITDDSCPDRERFQPTMHPSLCYLLALDGEELLGLFLFVPQNAVCWEVHTCLLPNAWGERAKRAAREAAQWIWRNTPCRRIVTTVPEYNRLALRLAKAAGMTAYGCNPMSFLKHGKLYYQSMLGISREG